MSNEYTLGKCRYNSRGKTKYVILTAEQNRLSGINARLYFNEQGFLVEQTIAYACRMWRGSEVAISHFVRMVVRDTSLEEVFALPLNASGIREYATISSVAIMQEVPGREYFRSLVVVQEEKLLENPNAGVFIVGIFSDKNIGGITRDHTGKMFRTGKFRSKGATKRNYMKYPVFNAITNKGECPLKGEIKPQDEFAALLLNKAAQEYLLDQS